MPDHAAALLEKMKACPGSRAFAAQLFSPRACCCPAAWSSRDVGPALGVGFVLLYHFFGCNPRFQKWSDACSEMRAPEERLAKITEE